MSSFFTNLETWFVTTEADVVNLIAKIKADVLVAEKDALAALQWVAKQTPTIVAGLQTAVSLASAVGVVTAPELAAAHAAVVALDAFAAAQSKGTDLTSTTQAVVQGYVAYQNATSAVASAKAAAANAPKK